MKITFLGTGTSQGVPVIGCRCRACRSDNPKDKRLRTSVMVETGGKVFVIDTGPDFRQQMLRENVAGLTAILLTHEHKDHVAGLDDIRAFNYIMQKEIDVYATERVQQALKKQFHYVFADDKYPGVPFVKMHSIDNRPFSIEGVDIIPIEVKHHQMPVFGFRIGGFSYITDANFISDEEKDKVRESKVLVLNTLRNQKHISHFSFEEGIELMEELRPGKGYFTHISHQLGLHEDLAKELPGFIAPAYDGLTIEL